MEIAVTLTRPPRVADRVPKPGSDVGPRPVRAGGVEGPHRPGKPPVGIALGRAGPRRVPGRRAGGPAGPGALAALARRRLRASAITVAPTGARPGLGRPLLRSPRPEGISWTAAVASENGRGHASGRGRTHALAVLALLALHNAKIAVWAGEHLGRGRWGSSLARGIATPCPRGSGLGREGLLRGGGGSSLGAANAALGSRAAGAAAAAEEAEAAAAAAWAARDADAPAADTASASAAAALRATASAI